MASPFWKAVVLGFGLLSTLQCADWSSAEMNDPFAAVSATSILAHYSPKKQVSGAFKIQSSEALYPLLSRLSIDFQRYQPNVAIEVKKAGSKAVEEFLQPPLSKIGKIMMVDERASSFRLFATSHQLADPEIKEFVAQHGYEPTAVPVAVGAVALYVHKQNPLVGLTLDQVDALFSSTRKRGSKTAISQWGQVGVSDGRQDASIELYSCERKSAAREFFQEYGLVGGEFKSGIHEDPGSASVVVHVGGNPTSIGYSRLGLDASNVRAVPIAEADGWPFVAPSQETVADQTYPLRHALYLYFDKAPKAPVPEAVQEFLSFILSQEGEERVMKAGFFPLPSVQAENRSIAFGFSTGRTLSPTSQGIQ